MFLVVSYDIPDDERRAKVCDKLKDYGEHIQYSVFECYLNSVQVEELKSELEKIIHPNTDSVKYYFLCQSCVTKIHTQGKRKYFNSKY